VRYIDAGYAVALSGLAFYALGLLARRSRLERAGRAPVEGEDGPAPTPSLSS
jgi:hypothetical protein